MPRRARSAVSLAAMENAEQGQEFQHGAGFEQGEAHGHVRLGKFEAHYEEIFAEVIEDGVITAEERARLDRAADSLGLDKGRLRKLETALQAAYETRFRIKVREVGLPPVDAPELEDAQRISLEPLAPTGDARTKALERRVAFLEARIRELEAALEEAQSHVAVEVDLSGVTGAPPGVTEDHESLERRLRHDPRDASALHGLFQAFTREGQRDRAFAVAQVTSFLGVASPEESALHDGARPQGLLRPTAALTSEAWRRLLAHPDEEVLTGEIFSVIAPAVLLGRVSALRRDKALPHLDPTRREDPVQSTLQAVRGFAWGAAILGMAAPAIFTDPDFEGGAEVVPGVPPATRLGRRALSGRSAAELAFVAGRHLAWYREERFVRLLVPSIADLEDLFLAALHIGNPGIPLTPTMRQRVMPLAQAIEPILEAGQVDRLRGHFLRFVEEGGRANLQRWATGADKTACRAGLLLSGDLKAAKAMLDLEDRAHAEERFNDLLAFTTSERYAKLRKQIGVALN